VRKLAWLVLALAILCGCGPVIDSLPLAINRSLYSPIHSAQDPRLNATLWQQTSAEYRVLAQTIYSIAKFQLDRALVDKEWTAEPSQKDGFQNLPPAVIMDIDETVLDNSVFQARLIHAGAYYSDSLWKSWTKETGAVSIPGAVEFVSFAQARDITVFFVTGRHHSDEQETRTHLRSVGINLPKDKDTVLMRGERKEWEADKASRREFIAHSYRVLLLIGDDLGDFISGHRGTPPERTNNALNHNAWGTKWFLLPNPTYGSWIDSLHDFDFTLSKDEILRRKLQYLRLEPVL
jgi:acid phosphatase